MSGLIALLDDVAAISKVAAASVDDVAGMAAKAGAKAAGAVIDDAAVTPKYVAGFDASRELPIVWKIAKGSIFNKMVILLPVALLLSAFAPWLISPLLMLGGAYLCFEGAEKIWHWLFPGAHGEAHDSAAHGDDGTSLEETRVAGAIKTDFILSAEIMTIVLSAVPADQHIAVKAAVLALVGLGITLAVYGSVALIVKADDVGLHLARRGRGAVAALGRAIVTWMPAFMQGLMIIGTAAMLWVGGQIIIHSLHMLGQHAPYDMIHRLAEAAAQALPQSPGLAGWATQAVLDGLFGLGLGLVLIPVATRVISPLISALRGKRGTLR